MANFKTTIKRDGTVKFWNVFTQQWSELTAQQLVSRGEDGGKKYLATLPETDRERIRETARRVFGSAC